MNANVANEMVIALSQHLARIAREERYPVDEYGDRHDGHGGYVADDSPAGEQAREWCRALLKAAEADGMGGCRLCRG